MQNTEYPTTEEKDTEVCPETKDGNGHCEHWWDGEMCCWCGALAMTKEQKREQGML
jgi:hypothetical protein